MCSSDLLEQLKTMSNLILAISHNIFITEDQEKEILERNPVELMGVSVPVWHHSGKSSEPAKEVFCKYFIHNIPFKMIGSPARTRTQIARTRI